MVDQPEGTDGSREPKVAITAFRHCPPLDGQLRVERDRLRNDCLASEFLYPAS